MKKIININLSGRVVPIEDSAYESLQRYIESLRRYFANEEGRDEIINDIESRIAELMNDKIKKGAAAITDDDVLEIINSMGRIEDFEQVEAEERAASSGPSTTNFTYGESRKGKGRLYLDASDKLLGGVCAGIANYMNVDPDIIRLLFAIITFGGFGTGIITISLFGSYCRFVIWMDMWASGFSVTPTTGSLRVLPGGWLPISINHPGYSVCCLPRHWY